MITVYEYPKCSTCQKAKKWLVEHGESIEAIDLVKQTPDAQMIEQWIRESQLPIRRFFNTSGMTYRALGLKDKVDGFTIEEASHVLASDGMLIKRPVIVRDGFFLLNGFKVNEYEGVL